MSEGRKRRSGEEAEAEIQGLVLEWGLKHYPALLSFDELARMVTTESAPVSAVDVREAVAELASAGLMHRVDNFAWPTHSAWRKHTLPDA
ncbi:MAG: hypothetical protein ACJ76L_07700 [Conexibacter sp.]